MSGTPLTVEMLIRAITHMRMSRRMPPPSDADFAELVRLLEQEAQTVQEDKTWKKP